MVTPKDAAHRKPGKWSRVGWAREVLVLFRRHSPLLAAFMLAGMATSSTPASVMGPPQYYVRAEITDISAVRGGVHEIRFSIEGIVQDQDKYGGSRSAAERADTPSHGMVHSIRITLSPEVSLEGGQTIVVGVVHGSSMGEDGPVAWTQFVRPCLVDGTPIGLHYPARN